MIVPNRTQSDIDDEARGGDKLLKIVFENEDYLTIEKVFDLLFFMERISPDSSLFHVHTT